MQAANLNEKKIPFVGKDVERITAECFLFFHLNDEFSLPLKRVMEGDVPASLLEYI